MDLSESDKKFLQAAVSPPMKANAFFLSRGESLSNLTDTVMTYLCDGIFQISYQVLQFKTHNYVSLNSAFKIHLKRA